MYEVRYSTWLLSTNPSPQTLDIVLKGLDRFTESLQLADAALTGPNERDLMRRLQDETAVYRNFVTQSGTMTTERQQLALQGDELAARTVTRVEALTENFAQESAATQRAISVQLVAVLGLAVLVGVGLTLLLTRNVLGQLGLSLIHI